MRIQKLDLFLSRQPRQNTSDRYDSVSALSADIKAYQTARPVNAYSGSPVYKFTKLLKRAPIASALAASFVAALTIGLGTSQHYASKATAEAKRANIELERAEWALGNATTQNAVAESYADALQRTIGGEDDVKRVRDVFMAHWENIVTNPESSDDVKAHVSFALGKHLIEQGDFVNGVKVLEPWLEDDYGSYTLRRSATALLGTAYTYQNRGRDALKKIMDVATMYEGEFDENSPAHVKASIKAAYYSHRPDIMQKAKDVAMKTLQTDITITERWDIWNQIMNLELLRGDFHGAYDATLEGKKLYATTVGIAATDIATVNVNYCELTFFVKRKNNDTKVCLENLLNSEHEQLALISSGVEIFSIKALLAREEGELLNAEAFIQTALTRNFNGTNKDNPNLKDAEIYAVMIKSDLGKWDEAKRIIDRAKTRKGRHAKNDIAIMEAYFLLKQQGQDAMMVYLKDSEFNKKYARAFFRLVYIMDEMTDLGVAWDAL